MARAVVEEPEYLTPVEVAARLNLSLTTVKREMARGNLARVKVGGSNRIHRDEFAAYIEARSTGGAR